MISKRMAPLVTAIIVVTLLIVASADGCAWGEAESIMVYSGASTRKPMDEIGELFQQKYGIEVHYNYAGSNALLSQMELTQEGDVYMPAETYYIDVAREKGFIDYEQPVAYHIPVIAVPKGNPANITGLNDLTRPDVKLVWGDPEVAAIGRMANGILKKNGIYDAVWAKDIDTTPTANELIVYIAMGQADATINWRELVVAVEDIEIIEIPREQSSIEVIPVGSLTFSKDKAIAEKFVDFCASDEGKAIFEKYGFPAYPNPEYE